MNIIPSGCCVLNLKHIWNFKTFLAHLNPVFCYKLEPRELVQERCPRWHILILFSTYDLAFHCFSYLFMFASTLNLYNASAVLFNATFLTLI